jgi:hypothetical protein
MSERKAKAIEEVKRQVKVSADIIQNSAVGIFSPNTEGTKTSAARVH